MSSLDDFSADDGAAVGGVHIKYLVHCPRQLWLYARGYRPEHRSDRVAFGEVVADTTFTRRRDIDLGEAKVDWVTTGAVVHETKSSRAPSPAHAAQVRHYCLLLERRGITVRGGTVHYPLIRRTTDRPLGRRRPHGSRRRRNPSPQRHRRDRTTRATGPHRLPRLLLRRLLLGRLMPAAGRTYWLTEPCRIRREDNSIRVERPDGSPVRIPITDIHDLIAFDHVDLNTSALSLLSRNGVTLHILDHYGNHAGHFSPAESMASAAVIRRQVEITADPDRRTAIGQALVLAAAENLRWALDTDLLDPALQSLRTDLPDCKDNDAIMGQEGNFRRTAWAVLDTQLPPWLRLNGRTRRPPPPTPETPSSATSTPWSTPAS
ncbi:CRISPR-associated endonuclease Cas1 [Streptomyces nigrescens]